MLGGRDEHALAHQAGGVADPGNVFAVGGNAKPIEVGAAEQNTNRRASRANPHGGGQTAVQPHAAEFDRSEGRGLELQSLGSPT